MKILIALATMMLALNSWAKAPERVLMEDYFPLSDREFAYEIKTKEFDKVILDCGGFLGWMSFYRNNKIAYNVYLDTYGDCPNMHDFLNNSKERNVPVCLMVEGKNLTVSNEPDDCQQIP